MFFPRNSLFFQAILLRVKSMRFLCYSRLFAPFLRPSYAFQLRDWSTLFLWQSLLYYSFAILDISYPFRCLNFSFPGLHFSVLRYSATPKCNSFPSPIYQASRLSRSCCSRVSDSLAVCSSHRGNLYIRC